MSTRSRTTPWNIPAQRNPFFTGREEVISQLHRALHTENAVALSHPYGISGLGGIGKTQTALEYAYRYGPEYDAVLWVRADSPVTLTSSFVELAHVLNLPERNEQDQNIIIEAVQKWFRHSTGWLLIFDNADDLAIAEPFLPKAGPGHILFTTRAQAFGGLASRLEVQKMEEEVGALLLLRRSSHLPLQATLDMASPDDQSTARVISEELDGLPLALDQAGAYIKEAPCSLPDYLPRYQTRRSDILGMRGSFDEDYPASVATTWSLSFEKVNQANPASAELLHFCAYLSPNAIPEEMMTKGAQHLGPVLQPVLTHPLQFDQSIAVLRAYSLITRKPDDRMLSIHRLVQTVLQDALPAETGKQWQQRTVLAVNEAFPVVTFEEWTRCDRLLPHVLVCANWKEQELTSTLQASHLFHNASVYLRERGQYTDAEPLLNRVCTIHKQLLGDEHPDTAKGLHSLANVYWHQGKYEQAEAMYRQVLSIYEQCLGAEELDVAAILNDLAILYRRMGKYEQMEALYQRALAISEHQSGAEHPNTAKILNNLAILYWQQGKHKQAEPVLERALTIYEHKVGAEHPDIAMTLNNLGGVYADQEKYEQAEPLFKRVRSIYEQALGDDHPDTALALNQSRRALPVPEEISGSRAVVRACTHDP